MERYDQITNVKTKRGPHLWRETSTPKKDSHQRVLRAERSYFPPLQGSNKKTDHQSFNRWWDLTFGDEERATTDGRERGPFYYPHPRPCAEDLRQPA